MQSRVHMIGNAHLDPAWLWRWQEGFAEIKATYKSALDRMDEFEDFVFTGSSASYYKWILENDPQMFNEIKARVAEGRWVLVGGMWVQPDCNIPSGESFIRQTLYSQHFLKEHFGIIARTGYNVDSFGHHANLPQILSKSGMTGYVYMRPGIHEKSDLPVHIFNWKSMDGSQILCYRIPTHYGHLWEAPQKEHVEEQKIMHSLALTDQINEPVMNFYGVGNHGGGPTIENLQMIKSLQAIYGNNTIAFSDPDAFFTELSDASYDFPSYLGELQHHAQGCYSANSDVKLLNRRSEERLIQAEKMSTLSGLLLGTYEHPAVLKKAWEPVMFNQFHDILAGCSIKEVYEDATEMYGMALSIAANTMNHYSQKISWAINTQSLNQGSCSKEHDWILWGNAEQGTPMVVFNPHSWPCEMPIEVNWSVHKVLDCEGNEMLTQPYRTSYSLGHMRYGTLFVDTIPAFGYKLYWLHKEKNFIKNGSILKNLFVLENDLVRISFDEQSGYIKEYFLKLSKKDLLTSTGAAIPIIMDIQAYDTWGHNTDCFRNEVGRFGNASFTCIEAGPVRIILRVISHYNQSILRQDYILYKDRSDLEVVVHLDFREKHAMLKLSFPLKLATPKVFCEIPYGVVERCATGVEEPMQRWVSLVQEEGSESRGMAVLNTGKYGYDCKENDLRITIANSSLYADHLGERDGLGDYLDQGIQSFKYALVPITQNNWKTNVTKKGMQLQAESIKVFETYHEGPLPHLLKMIEISNEALLVTAFKRAEADHGYILRLYESSGSTQEATIELPYIKVKWTATFCPSEIKTFFISDDTNASVTETWLIEFDPEKGLVN